MLSADWIKDTVGRAISEEACRAGCMEMHELQKQQVCVLGARVHLALL